MSEIIPAAQRLREEQIFYDIRGYLKAIRIAYDEHGLSSANKLVENWKRQVHKASIELKRSYGINTGQGI